LKHGKIKRIVWFCLFDRRVKFEKLQANTQYPQNFNQSGIGGSGKKTSHTQAKPEPETATKQQRQNDE